LSVKVHYDKIKFRIRRSGEIKKFLEKVIRDENKIAGDLSFIFTGDNVILEINREFLNHDYYTDVIAFDYSKQEIVNGEIYISSDTVKKNARINNVRIFEEILRVMIHGILHLCGYSDVNTREGEIMFEKQEEKVREFINR